MARAVQNKKIEYVAVESPGEVVLTLTPEEALTLRRVTHSVGGTPKGRRGHIDAIGVALESAGISMKGYPQWFNSPESLGDLRVSGGIVFADPDGKLPSERLTCR